MRPQEKLRPLLLDKTLGFYHQVRASSSTFLKLPSEILAVVASFINTDAQTLKSLAFVNTICRQLARSCQFSDILLQFNPRGELLVDRLNQEAHFNRESPRIKVIPIGVCIRRVIVSFPTPELGNERHEYFRLAVLQAIETAMPNLEILIWGGYPKMDASLFRAIGESPLKRLVLSLIEIRGINPFEKSYKAPKFPLRSLSFRMSISAPQSIQTAYGFESFLRLYASTL